MNITVFGSSKPVQGEPDYIQAYQLGKLIAENGHVAITGGYKGTMEAVSRGAAEAGGRVIGVTCRQIETWRDAKANPWVGEERKKETLNERLAELILVCDAAIALPGGPGTLAEISLLWNLLVIQAIPTRPFALVGGGWQTVFASFKQNLGIYNGQADWEWLRFAPNVESAFQIVTAAR
jgi:uncharacterized protein (TIGR00725 family)